MTIPQVAALVCSAFGVGWWVRGHPRVELWELGAMRRLSRRVRRLRKQGRGA